jgi:lipopolysaccharide biosynthesis protein
MTKRLAIAFHSDEDGIVDNYMLHLVDSLKPFVQKTIFVANSQLNRDSELAVRQAADELLICKNILVDVWAYKLAFDHVGFDALQSYDEVLLYNSGFYGPIYPFSEMFDAMAARPCDFWGITAHSALAVYPFTEDGTLPCHLNTHFVVIRKPMLGSIALQSYLAGLDPIEDHMDQILEHESHFTHHFHELGYEFETYIDTGKYRSPDPARYDVADVITKRCPVLKRSLFTGDTAFIEENAIDLVRTLEIMRETSNYDERMIWTNVARLAQLRTLNANAALMSILSDETSSKKVNANKYGKIAVCAHIYYVDMLDEVFTKTNNIPVPYDFIATTETDEKKRLIEEAASRQPNIRKVIVRKVEQNRGRDMSALFISCRDLFLDDHYDLVCRLHTKKTPQVQHAMGALFKRHMIDNILKSRGYVINLLDLLVERPWIGLAMPPVVQIAFRTIGFSWYNNKERAQEVADLLGLNVKFDESTPVAAYGTMFWFRPAALRKLFARQWKWEEFNLEPDHIDGGLAHILERLIAYTAQDASFAIQHVMNTQLAAQNYAILEYKVDKLGAPLPFASVSHQAHLLKTWKSEGYPLKAPAPARALPTIEQSDYSEPSSEILPEMQLPNGNYVPPQLTVSAATRELRMAMKRSLRYRAHWVFLGFRPLYRATRTILTFGRR